MHVVTIIAASCNLIQISNEMFIAIEVMGKSIEVTFDIMSRELQHLSCAVPSQVELYLLAVYYSDEVIVV